MIIQRINLYRVDRGVEPDLSFLRISQIWGTFLVVLLIYSAIMWGLAHRKEGQVKILETQSKTISAQLALKKSTFNIADDQKKLQADIDGLIVDRRQKGLLLETLKAQGLTQKQGFSTFLDGLAKNHVEGTWFTRMVISDGGGVIALSGGAVQAKLIPVVFQNLAQDVAYKGKAFDKMVIKQGDDTSAKKSSKTTGQETEAKISKNQVSFEAKTAGVK